MSTEKDSKAIVPVSWEIQTTAANYRMATDVAGLCREIVVKSAVDIHGKKYVRAEGWQAIATAHGCVGSARDVEVVETGIRCIGEVRKVSDGTVIATAEGFVGNDEGTWAKRPEYARRAMCQTRAISRACRSCFAHVVVLMDCGLSTTPAEEVPEGGFGDGGGERRDSRNPQQSKPADGNPVDEVPAAYWNLEAAARPAWLKETYGEGYVVRKIEKSWRVVKLSETKRELDIQRPSREPEDLLDTDHGTSVEPRGWEDTVIHFGKNKGCRLGDLEIKQLAWYQKEWQPRPFHGRISDQDKALRGALDVSMGKDPTQGYQPGEDEELDEVPF